MPDSCNVTGINFFYLLFQTVSYLCGNVIHTQVNLTVLKIGYVKGVRLNIMICTEIFVSIKKDAMNFIQYIVSTPEVRTTRKTLYIFEGVREGVFIFSVFVMNPTFGLRWTDIGCVCLWYYTGDEVYHTI